MVTGRDRILAAMDGDEPDAVPLALAFYRVGGTRLAPPGAWRDDLVDIEFVEFPISDEEAELRRIASPHEGNTRIGNAAQVARYATWGYRPETPEARNPLELARTVADLERFRFPAVAGPLGVDGLARAVDDVHRRGLAAGGNTPHLGGELFEAAWRLRGLEAFSLARLTPPRRHPRNRGQLRLRWRHARPCSGGWPRRSSPDRHVPSTASGSGLRRARRQA
jgi:hypothetical protein